MAERVEVRVPLLGDVESVDVIEVPVKPGDRVEENAPLITLESDKATMEVPSPVAGKIAEIKVEVGDKVKEGDVIAIVETASSEAEAASPQGGESEGQLEPQPSRETAPKTSPLEKPKTERQPTARPQLEVITLEGAVEDTPLEEIPYASPAVRKFARKLGVDLREIKGSGPKGRILREDVENFVKEKLRQFKEAPSAGFTLPPILEVDFAKFGPIEEQPLSRIKKRSGPHLHRAWLSVPHVTQHIEADITELEDFRRSLKKEAEARGIRLTPLAFILRTLVRVLQELPQFNASLAPDGERLILKRYYHIGVAVATPEGLVVPVIRDVDQKSIFEIASHLVEVSQRARDGKLKPSDLQGGSFTVSSLGGIGGSFFTPIVNAPEVAILGIGRAEMRPVWQGEQFVPRLMLPLSLSYDHRVIDGAEGAQFLVRLSEYLADLRRVLL